MGEREIRAKYGGKLAKAINRAIRAEVTGGNEGLDKLTELAGAARASHWTDHAGHDTPEALAYFRHQRDVVDRMEAEVRRRWGVPPSREGKRTGGSGKGGRKPAPPAGGKPKKPRLGRPSAGGRPGAKLAGKRAPAGARGPRKPKRPGGAR